MIHRGLVFHNIRSEEQEAQMGGFWVARSLGGMQAEGVPVKAQGHSCETNDKGNAGA